MTSRAARLRALAVAGCIALFFAVAVLGRLKAGAAALDASDRALEKGDRLRAIDEARAAAVAVAPLSPYSDRGYARLDAIAREAESRDDDVVAGAAWRAMRTAAIATRALGVDHDRALARANEGIARTSTHSVGAGRTDLPHDQATASPAERRFADSLARDDTPPVHVFLLLGVGALLFFAGVARLVTMDPFVATRARMPIAAAVIGVAFAAWALAR